MESNFLIGLIIGSNLVLWPIMLGLYISSPKKKLIVEKKTALDKFKEKETSFKEIEKDIPLNRLKLFCSLSMDNKDWEDAQTFFKSLEDQQEMYEKLSKDIMKQVKSLKTSDITFVPEIQGIKHSDK